VPERLPPRPHQQNEPEPAASPAGQIDLFAPKARKAEPAAPAQRIYTVGELTREVKGVLEGRFGNLQVKGEVSNLRRPSSGHLYFTLKDPDACIDAVLFSREARRLRFAVENGLSVLVRGRLSLYEPQGRYQIVCDSLEPLGAGALQVAFEQLRARLEAQGLFDPARKRKLPFLPRRIAVVTSPSGAAVHDFLRVLHRRFPGLPVLVVPARVQGDGAAHEIACGIARGSGARGVDVLVVAAAAEASRISGRSTRRWWRALSLAARFRRWARSGTRWTTPARSSPPTCARRPRRRRPSSSRRSRTR
jgi:hypothetical protein